MTISEVLDMQNPALVHGAVMVVVVWINGNMKL